jgi:rod shape-determining protein MreC
MRRAASSPRRAIVVGVLLVGAAVGLLRLDRQGRLPPVARALPMRLVAPLHDLVTSAAHGVRGVWFDYLALGGVREENKRLQAENERLKAQLAQSAGLEQENARLRGLLDLGDRRKDLRLRAARVVGRGTSPYFRVMRIVLAVGEGEVTEGMPVVAPGGIVGQIRTVSGDRAEVMLVTDPRSAVDVVLEKSGARGVAVGTGDPERYAARLEYLQRTADAVVGERVISTGDDNKYPRGLPVGELVSVSDPPPSGPFRKAELAPAVDLSALEEVFVVLGPTGLTADGKALQVQAPKGEKGADKAGARAEDKAD